MENKYLNELISTFEEYKLKKETNEFKPMLMIRLFNPDKIKYLNQERSYLVMFDLCITKNNNQPVILEYKNVLINANEPKITEVLKSFVSYIIDQNEIEYTINLMNANVLNKDTKDIFFIPEINTMNKITITIPHNDLSFIEEVTKANQKAKFFNLRLQKDMDILEEQKANTSNVVTLQKK